MPKTHATAATLEKSDRNLIWLDCEMTGLYPQGNPQRPQDAPDRLLEIAVVVTDAQLGTRIEGPALVIHQSTGLLDQMDKWNKHTHGKSGLIDRSMASTLTEEAAQEQILAFVKRYVPRATSPMCGNTIGQDRRFLLRYMPRLEAYFHYRNIDVSTLKELALRWKPEIKDSFVKAQKHTALADVHESIDELLHYRREMMKI